MTDDTPLAQLIKREKRWLHRHQTLAMVLMRDAVHNGQLCIESDLQMVADVDLNQSLMIADALDHHARELRAEVARVLEARDTK